MTSRIPKMKTDSNKCSNLTPRHFHPEKRGIRIFGIAESFKKSNSTSTLGGVVMRRDLIVDGIVFGSATLKGDDSTKNIYGMFRSLQRDDINCIMLDGLIISLYNIIDGEKLNNITGLPIIAITFEDSRGLEEHIKHHFLEKSEMKLEQYLKLGNRDQVRLRTDKSLYIRYWGLSLKGALNTLNAFTLQGSIPEPIRVAKLLARAHRNSINS
ncbi:MAG TPA: DUF99 family protein [Nitrososphaeraceae archaeon]|nr:DUF99 family protein [Nitrososphaeraceae archaeon]